MIVNSFQLETSAVVMEKESDETRNLANGVPVTAPQLRAAAHLLREASERPGFIEPARQREGVLIFDVGILTGCSYAIKADGTVGAADGSPAHSTDERSSNVDA